MKQIRIIPIVTDGAVMLYISSRAPEFRVYRERMPVAMFTASDAERMNDGAALLYEGVLEKASKGRVQYRDDTVEANSMYYYWIEELWPEGGKLGHPVLVRVQHPRVWWSRSAIQSYMEQVAADFPAMAELRTCGRTTRNYPLNYLWVGNRARSVLYIGAVHAGESGPEIILPAVRRILETEPELLEKVGVAVLPAVGADCRQDEVEGRPEYLRTNPNGVDINRNFPAGWEEVSHMYDLSTDFRLDCVYRGHAPCSEAETRAVMEMTETVQPVIAFSCHWMGSVCEDAMLISAAGGKDPAYMEKAEEINEVYCEAFEALLEVKKRPEERRVGAVCTGGSFPTWCFSKGIPAFDIEGGRHEAFKTTYSNETTPEVLELASACHENALRAILRYAAQQ